MDWAVRISAFYKKACADNRISPVHISLYFALLREASNQNFYCLRREDLMENAKISSRVTYHRCLRELHEYGYIDYRPSYVAGKSAVKLVVLE